jgi:hypothetical protein
MQSEGKDAKGRNYDQVTKDGAGSVASAGAGGTGDIGEMGSQHNDWGHSDVGSGNMQSGSRTDDLLAPAADQEQGQGFTPGGQPGSMQSGDKGNAGAPEAGGQRTRKQGFS